MPAKRDPSLIPLSHDHHHALVRVFEIRQALGRGTGLAEQVTATREFWARSLVPHFAAEEQVVFPLLAGVAAALVEGLRDQHRTLGELIGALDATEECLGAFAALLERHIRLEERQLFASYQEHVPAVQRAAVGTRIRAILQRSDDARDPGDLPPRD